MIELEITATTDFSGLTQHEIGAQIATASRELMKVRHDLIDYWIKLLDEYAEKDGKDVLIEICHGRIKR